MSGLSAYQSLKKRGPSEQYISHKVSVSFPESRQDRQQQTEVLVPQSDKPTENLTLCIALASSLCFYQIHNSIKLPFGMNLNVSLYEKYH